MGWVGKAGVDETDDVSDGTVMGKHSKIGSGLDKLVAAIDAVTEVTSDDIWEDSWEYICWLPDIDEDMANDDAIGGDTSAKMFSMLFTDTNGGDIIGGGGAITTCNSRRSRASNLQLGL